MNRIKELRKQKGVTMRKLSEDIVLKSERTVSRWEKGNN
jgi:transcriptional regulator with XRE-family HTH domain|uniref:Helix-turn-helix domain protein n=1 Tax=Siphoviridae sp. ctPJ52 TaxID=2825483 RepID=A0A8S5US21_9CAUD|nr:MAG TPA: helix-turn-helix domain protein [Siphoviridae sp. ctPJ52]